MIGRESELAEVQAALKAHRVVTLDRGRRGGQDTTGPGGRRPLAGNYPDGVWVIELAPVADPAAVPEAFAAVLGIIQQPGLSL